VTWAESQVGAASRSYLSGRRSGVSIHSGHACKETVVFLTCMRITTQVVSACFRKFRTRLRGC